ncbi:MAG: anaerobic ribonucleoside-triphosphate reductase activating protein [Deltaproteobacteria bacterium]|nr:anaerobic ribonucleoside-triphosphate reductase activating protein [Deltaproteobacteria bacterium]
MRIGGLAKVSALDFPGGVCATIFTLGCNFRCPYCHNPDLVLPSSGSGPRLDEGGILTFLGTRTRYLDGVVISGGEPTLQADLEGFAGNLKAMGFRVKLDTNGSRPAVVGRILALKLADYVALDLKCDPGGFPPGLAAPGLAPAAASEAVRETLGLLKASVVPHEFRTTCYAPFVDDRSIEAIARAAAGNAPLYLQPLRTGRVLDPSSLERHPAQPGPEDLERFREIACRHLPCHIR